MLGLLLHSMLVCYSPKVYTCYTARTRRPIKESLNISNIKESDVGNMCVSVRSRLYPDQASHQCTFPMRTFLISTGIQPPTTRLPNNPPAQPVYCKPVYYYPFPYLPCKHLKRPRHTPDNDLEIRLNQVPS